MSIDSPSKPSPGDSASVGDVVNFVKTYAQQETVGPLKGAGRWIAMGAMGATLLGLGLSLMMLGLLRLIQSEWDPSRGWSWVPYLGVLVATGVLIVLVMMRINKTYLNKEAK